MNSYNFENEQFDLRAIASLFWRSRFLIGGMIVLGTGIAITAAKLAPKQFTAEVVVSPVTDTPGLVRLVALVRSHRDWRLGVVDGCSVSVTDIRRAETLATLQSEMLTTAYISSNNLLPVLFPDRWNESTKQWKPDKKAPTLWEANRFFATSIRSVATDAKTGLVSVAVTWGDPSVAAKWANDLVEKTNEYLRDQAIADTKKNIAYLSDQAVKTEFIGVRQAITSLLESELNRAMLARGSDHYVLKVIDAAVPPEQASSPNLLLWAFMGFFASAAMAVMLVLARRLFGAISIGR